MAQQAVSKNDESAVQPGDQGLALLQRDAADIVLDRVSELVSEGGLHLPEDYSAANALKQAWLILQGVQDKSKQPALKVCTKDSIVNSLLDMVVQGLNPGKAQCYFVVYGNKLVMMRSYMGDKALLRRVYPGARVFSEIIWKGDKVQIEIRKGRKFVTKHETSFENMGGFDQVVGAYAIAELGEEHEDDCEIMTIEQIEKAWARGQNYAPGKKDGTHKDHAEQMARKTVIARLCSKLVNESDDAYLREAMERSSHVAAESQIDNEAEQNANGEIIDIDSPPKELSGQIGDEDAPEAAPAPELGEDASPKERFEHLVKSQGLDLIQARRKAARVVGLKRVEDLGDEHYREILDHPEWLTGKEPGEKGLFDKKGPGF